MMLTPRTYCQNRVSADQYHLTVSRACFLTHRVYVVLKLSTRKLIVFKYSQTQTQFCFNAQEISRVYELNN